MSLMLYRLGRFSYRHPGRIIAAWLVALMAVGGLIWANGGAKIAEDLTINGTESQLVLDQLRDQLPVVAGGQGTLVFQAPTDAELRLDEGEYAERLGRIVGQITELPQVVGDEPTAAEAPPAVDQPEPTEAELAALAEGPHPLVVDGVAIPTALISGDGHVAMVGVQFTEPMETLDEAVLETVTTIATDAFANTDVAVLVSDSLKQYELPLGSSELVGLVVAALVLIVTLGSLRAAGMPLANALVGVGVGLGAALALSHQVQLTSATPILALMIGLAVGIDYALFIVNRQRHLILTERLPAEEAAARALGTAGSAVFFAGLTVVIALCGLTLINISFLTTMALVAAFTVACAVAVALTFLPALLGLMGERIVTERLRQARRGHRRVSPHRFARWWSGRVVRLPWVAMVIVVAILGVATIPAASLTLGMPNGATANLDTAERQAYEATKAGFGEGFSAPLLVVVETETTPITPELIEGAQLGLMQTEHVSAASVIAAAPEENLAVFQVIPDAHANAPATTELVHDLRAHGAAIAGAEDASVGVTGMTAIAIDISERLSSVLPLYVAIIVGLSLLVLLLVFRSIVIPLKATLGFLLTLGATLGITTAVFQWGWGLSLIGTDTASPVVNFLPILVTGILYGLAMDYELFLVSSMREAHVAGELPTQAIVTGFAHSSRVVTAAAIIMVSVFASFVFTDDALIKQFGLALAIGILIDAFLVRMTLVPAVMAVLGRAVWWLPRWLQRLPHLDVEGARLTEHLQATAPQLPQPTSTP